MPKKREMPKISTKGMEMPSSPIRKLVPFAEKAKISGTKVHHLNIGQPDIETPQVARDAIRNFNESVLEYSHSAGNLSYRKALAEYYCKNGISVDDTHILITTGGSEALTFGIMSTCNPDNEIIIPEPFYANYNGFSVAAGVKIVPVTATIENGFALPSVEEIEQKITEKTKAIVICNPGNPTGYLYSEQELESLKELILKYDLFLFADEVYREFCYDGAKPHSVMNVKGLEEHVIMIDSVSKRYSMCGARIGALVTKNKEVIETALKFGQARLSPPTIDQIASEAALNTPQDYFSNVILEYVERRNTLVEGLNSIEGVYCPMPSGAFYCVASFPIDDADKFCQWLLEEFSYKGQTVMMAPASGFYSTKGKGKNEARLAYVLNKEALVNSIECLREALKVYPGRIA